MKNLKLWSSIITAGLILTACGGSGSAKQNYTITLKNLTYSQPMSPMAVISHQKNKKVFEIGEKATNALEKLAESGDNSKIIKEYSAKGGNNLILPSKSDSITIASHRTKCISLVSMLVNTNDAFVGASCIDISSLKKGKSLTLSLSAYDAGTEKNSELASTIPGPAGGGEGFNAKRDDVNFVHIHPNVISKDDGLATSALTQAHRWDNPVAMVTIEHI